MGIKVYLSTAFYLITDEQSEIANLNIKKHFCNSVNCQQNNRLEELTIIKFTANNNKSVFTKLFLFFAIRTLYLSISFNIVKLSNIKTSEQIL